MEVKELLSSSQVDKSGGRRGRESRVEITTAPGTGGLTLMSRLHQPYPSGAPTGECRLHPKQIVRSGQALPASLGLKGDFCSDPIVL